MNLLSWEPEKKHLRKIILVPKKYPKRRSSGREGHRRQPGLPHLAVPLKSSSLDRLQNKEGGSSCSFLSLRDQSPAISPPFRGRFSPRTKRQRKRIVTVLSTKMPNVKNSQMSTNQSTTPIRAVTTFQSKTGNIYWNTWVKESLRNRIGTEAYRENP
jgi:hypothetical protein